MKKLLLSSSILLTAFMSNAQISVGQWDVALPMTLIQVGHDSLVTDSAGWINPGPAGANQTWNFSTLTAHTVDTLTFTNPNWLPNASTFPNANLAIINPDGSETYLRNDATGLYVEGGYGDPFGVGAMAIGYSNSEQLFKWTDTYGTTFTDTGIATGEFPFSNPFLPTVDSARFKHMVIKTITTDGWGNITIPMGTYPCLRHSGMVLTIDSVWLHDFTVPGWFDVSGQFIPIRDSAWHFSWWGNGKGYALMEFDSTAGDTIRNLAFLNASPVIGSVHDASATLSMTTAYPNPAVNEIYFDVKTSGAASVEIFDLFGNKITSLALNNSKATYNTQQLSAGTYLYRSLDSSGKMTGKGMFEVMK
jgi:hypothetical protein